MATYKDFFKDRVWLQSFGSDNNSFYDEEEEILGDVFIELSGEADSPLVQSLYDGEDWMPGVISGGSTPSTPSAFSVNVFVSDAWKEATEIHVLVGGAWKAL